jgi:hypothetical protein
VPSTWQLVCREHTGAEKVLARGVLSFDLADDGAVVYTNGTGVFRLDDHGNSQQLCVGKLIEQVTVLNTAAP